MIGELFLFFFRLALGRKAVGVPFRAELFKETERPMRVDLLELLEKQFLMEELLCQD